MSSERETWQIFAAYAKKIMAGNPVFTIKPAAALDAHRKPLESLGLPDSTLHDWRHTYAVNWIRSGKKLAPLKKNLGHAANSTLVETRYGVWIVDDSDFSATTSATTSEKQHEA